MPAIKTLLLVNLLLSAASGQEATPKTYPQRVSEGLRTTVTSPAMRWHWTATGLSILLSLPLDDQIKERAVEHGLMSESLADLSYEWGGKWAALTILPGIYLTENIRGTSRETTFRRLDFAFTSLAMVGITTEVLKYVVGRPRPDKLARTSFPYGPSFPSGHASAAFGVAEVVRTLYGNRAGSVFYALAAITGISRIHDNKQYLSDVVAGAGLGIGLVRGFDLAQRPGDKKDTLQVTIAPGQVIIGVLF